MQTVLHNHRRGPALPTSRANFKIGCVLVCESWEVGLDILGGVI